MRKLGISFRACFVLLFMMFLFSSCFLQRRSVKEQKHEKEKEYVRGCREAWQYSDLQEEKSLEVILFGEAMQVSIVKRSGIFFCINSIGDTIAVLDMDYQGKIKPGTKVVFEPFLWEDWQKKAFTPIFFVYARRHKNEIFCAVKNVYYGKVKEVIDK